MYRPEGWEKRTRYGITVNNVDLDGIFEAGADAMLEGLKEGAKPTLKPGRIGDAIVGYLVFIPEE